MGRIAHGPPVAKLPHFLRSVVLECAKALIRCELVGDQRTKRRSSAALRFQTILADELARRQQVNPRYSLRAFAGSLGIEHSTLSQLLRGRRPITWKSIRSITPKMRWTGSSVLTNTADGLKFDSRRIARNLNLTVDEVNVALTDLCMFGLIELKGETT